MTALFILLSRGVAPASIAYGSINNFDTVNDTGVECHGFEIELDDLQSKDITYTYDWNHYGTPKITEDTTSVPGHTNVHVRYQAIWTNTGWSAYTAVPAGPIAPTQGHQFTNPGTNFGGEHFGVGYYGAPSTVKYNWLLGDGSGNLIQGPPVNVATPTFTYNPPQLLVPANVVAVIVPPPPPAPPPLQFGDASWVKEIKTTSHNTNAVHLRDLVGDDPGQPQPWANGENPEVEVEWKLLQTHFAHPDNPKGFLQGAPENLPGGNEIVTRRYEFYKYTGPIDVETGEAMADTVAANGSNGVGIVTYAGSFDPMTGDPVLVTNDMATFVVVGDFVGAQMSGFDADLNLGLIDHLPDGEVNAPYPTRSVVIAGDTNFTATSSGSLPGGLVFDRATGRVSGTPTNDGVFVFTVSVSYSNSPVITKTYPMLVAPAGVVPPPHSSVDASVSPANGGTATGTGVYDNGTITTVVAAPKPGFVFANWTENEAVVSTSAGYTFTNTVNQSLVANFVMPSNPLLQLQSATAQNFVIRWFTNYAGFVLQENSVLGTTNWNNSTNPVSTIGTDYEVTVPLNTSRQFFRLHHP